MEFQKIDQAVTAPEGGHLAAVVFDAPVPLCHAAAAGHGKAETAGPFFRKEDYGIIMPEGSDLRKPFNSALLKMRENGACKALYAK